MPTPDIRLSLIGHRNCTAASRRYSIGSYGVKERLVAEQYVRTRAELPAVSLPQRGF